MDSVPKIQIVSIQSDYTLTTLNARLEEKDSAIGQRITAIEKSVDNRFAHMTQLHEIVRKASEIATDKAEAQQKAINVASNEWRGTLNDFKGSLVSKTEHEQLRSDFAAYRLAQETLKAATAKSENREGKDDSRANIALIIAILVGAFQVAVYLKGSSQPQIQNTAPAVAPAPPVVIYERPQSQVKGNP